MPKKRIITAIFIAIIFSAALFFLESYAFSVFSAVVIVYAGWEWARLSGLLTPPLRLDPIRLHFRSNQNNTNSFGHC